MTHLCVAIFVTDLARARRDIAAAAEAGADLVELRIDQVQDAQGVAELLSGSVVPCIVTCRPNWEGGQSELADEARLALLQQAAEAGAAYLDLELETARRLPAEAFSSIRDQPRHHRLGLILSSHDFSGRPQRLYNILAELATSPADIAKVAWMARTVRDNLEAFEVLRTRQKPTIALCMGEAGLISRVLARKFGAFLTFASLEAGGGTAAGQISVGDMKKLYRWDAIGPQTRVYGVVAQPVMHSMSPAIHNAAFEAIGYDGVYLPLLVEAGYESFKAFMETFLDFEGMDLSGLSVTLPHKENALRYLQEKGADIEPLAQSIGAVNTIHITRPAGSFGHQYSAGTEAPWSLRGFNTDYAAILDSITSRLGISREALSKYRVAVLGAGGTGRTAVAALAHYGATIVVCNRTPDRAEALAEEFNGKKGIVVAAPLETVCETGCQILINTTSVGMHPNVDASPIGDMPLRLQEPAVVFDTIYNPIQTRLLKQAEEAGAKTIGGVEMFVRQAVAQFEAWTGHSAPTEVMRQVILRRLGG